jgi:hypothetical protein
MDNTDMVSWQAGENIQQSRCVDLYSPKEGYPDVDSYNTYETVIE